jgi:Protein of unknown function (DUF3179)
MRVGSVLVVMMAFLLSIVSSGFAAALTDAEVRDYTKALIYAPDDGFEAALDALVERGNADVVAGMILTMRYRDSDARLAGAISKLTGAKINSWNDAMLWQEQHPEVKPHSSFRAYSEELFARIDPQFTRFIGFDKTDPAKMKIRLEEIVWGGVQVDGIPALDDPKLISAKAADYLRENDLVFGVSINGDHRAYPLRIMGWHEMFNDTIGGVPVALAYCTLCGSGILFETKLEDRAKPLIFGSSGMLYRSNKLMFDRETDSLWNQFTGEPVSGKLVNSGIKLKIRPVTITSWKNWLASHADTKVLSLDTGFKRDYGSGVVYQDYFSSPDLMFPTSVRDESKVKRKDYVFGIRELNVARAWPVDSFSKTPVINDKFNGRKVVLIGDAQTRTVRAYERGEHTFSESNDPDVLTSGNDRWAITEDELIAPDGTKLARLSGHVAYWFAWDGYLGENSTLYSESASAN